MCHRYKNIEGKKMIHLKKEGDFLPSEMLRENPVLQKSIVVRRDFRGKKLTPEEFKEFQKVMNQHRPYCASDFVKHHFIENIAENPTQAAIYRARNEYFIKGY
jgi:hypothetical protein